MPGAAGLFFGLSLVYFFPALVPGQGIFGTDYLEGGYFFYEFVSGRFDAGEMPGWIPYIYGGLPLAANPGSTYYPVRLLADFLALPLMSSADLPASGLFAETASDEGHERDQRQRGEIGPVRARQAQRIVGRFARRRDLHGRRQDFSERLAHSRRARSSTRSA